MDDDAPLCALVKKPGFDDDTPLAALGKPKQPSAGGDKKGRPAKPKTEGGAPKPPKPAGTGTDGKPKVKKKKASSSSSSGSSSSSSSSSKGKKKGVKKAGAKKVAGKKGAVVKKKASAVEAEGDEGDEDADEPGANEPMKKRNRSAKEDAVAELLCRWWYVLPDWPPVEDSYYQPLLEKQGYKKVQIEEWEWVPDVDGKCQKKVYGLIQFKGLFRNVDGDLIDLRPKDTCPCLTNFMKKDLAEIYELLVKAYEAQNKALEESKYDETKLQMHIKEQLTRVRHKLNQANAVRSTKR